jgi:hypothetical protein
MLRRVSRSSWCSGSHWQNRPPAREPLLHRREMLHGVERAGSAARRVEVVGNDQVVGLAGGAHEAPRVGGHQPQARIGVAVSNMRVKCADASMTSGSSSTASTVSIASSVAEDAVTPVPSPRKSARFGRRVQQQGQQRLAPVGEQGRAAAFLLAVVDVQRATPLGVLHHAHRAMTPRGTERCDRPRGTSTIVSDGTHTASATVRCRSRPLGWRAHARRDDSAR